MKVFIPPDWPMDILWLANRLAIAGHFCAALHGLIGPRRPTPAVD